MPHLSPQQGPPSTPAGGGLHRLPVPNSSSQNHALQRCWEALRAKLPHYLEKPVISHFVDACEISFEEQHVVLEVPNANYYRGFVDQALPGLNLAKHDLGFEELFFRIKVRPRGSSSERSSPHHSPSTTPLISQKKGGVFTKISQNSGLKRDYTFASFVKGASNQFAHAVCQSVAQHPGSHYNPLFIYGHCGLGKTHLLHAVGHEILKQDPSTRVVFTTTDNFMSELIYCIRHSKQPHFKQKYAGCDVLLVDDIQFISGKKATQEEFFHVFNALYERRKQIIITSDKYPKEISDIEERLRNRFEWGLISDIQPPDVEHRMAILLSKAEKLEVTLPQDVAEYLATHWGRNVRELEGALSRMIAFAGFHGKPLSLHIAQSAFRSLDESSSKPATQSVEYEGIQNAVAHHFNVRISDLNSQKRQKAIAHPRQIAFYLARELVGASFPEIGRYFGGKNHTTVMHGVKRVEEDLKDDAELRLTLHHLKTKILNS